MNWRAKAGLILVIASGLVFSIWPALADAPWERNPSAGNLGCDNLLDRFVEAQTDFAAQRIRETMWGLECPGMPAADLDSFWCDKLWEQFTRSQTEFVARAIAVKMEDFGCPILR